jgi:hypothetical protein
MLAMYSDKRLNSSDNINNGKGFVSSVNNKMIYGLVSNDPTARLTEYSEYFIVFGKGEIQFKIGSDVIEFNIGHRFKSLNTDQAKDAVILSGEPKENSKI